MDLFGSPAQKKTMGGKDTNVLQLLDTDDGKAYLDIRIRALAEWVSMPGAEDITIAQVRSSAGPRCAGCAVPMRVVLL